VKVGVVHYKSLEEMYFKKIKPELELELDELERNYSFV